MRKEAQRGFVITNDAERAKTFDGDVLGFRLMNEDECAPSFDANGTMLRVNKDATSSRRRERSSDGTSTDYVVRFHPLSALDWARHDRAACAPHAIATNLTFDILPANAKSYP
jgi:hypothetical protein